ncbi:MAG: tetratricopeptide repeat protein [Desulfatibacillaceae bacterium]
MSKTRLICLALALLTLVVYAQVAGHDFVSWDDPKYVSDNTFVQQGLSFQTVKRSFHNFQASNWHPLTWISHILDYDIYGLNAGGHHVTNVVLHLLATIFLFLALRRMTGATFRSAFVAALFAVHPMHVESVAWVSERKDVLSMCFGALALWGYAWYAERPGIGRYVAMYVAFAASLLSKQTLVTLPFLLLVLDYWPLGRLGRALNVNGEDKGSRWGRLAFLFYEKLPLLALSGVALAMTFRAQSMGGSVAPVSDSAGLPVGFRLANAVVAYATYLKKFFWPWPMSPMYPLKDWPSPLVITASALVLAAVTAAVVLYRRGHPWLLGGWLWFLGTLVPVIGIVQLGWQRIADRYTYVPYVGLAIMAAWGAGALAKRSRRQRTALGAAAVAVLVVFTVAGWRQAHLWKDTPTLFTHAVRADPTDYVSWHVLANHYKGKGNAELADDHFAAALKANPNYYRGHSDYGAFLMEQGRPEQALDHFAMALRISPRFAPAWSNLGATQYQLGNLEKAGAAFARAVELSPGHLSSLNNLGLVLIDRGEYEKAAEVLKRALKKQPYFATAYANLGRAYRGQGLYAEAARMLETALQLSPGMADAYNDLGTVYLKLGRTDPARTMFEKTLEIVPDHEAAKRNLAMLERRVALSARSDAIKNVLRRIGEEPRNGMLYYVLGDLYRKEGKPARAVEAYEEASSLSPELFAAHNDLGYMYVQARRFDEARKALEKALSLEPESVEVHYNVACLFALSGEPDRAVSWLEKTVALGFDKPRHLAGDPDLAALRGRPDFEALVDELESRAAQNK